jgi:antitoxin (DNA-binding transcriptional repressor) of toxin-antitoxin stability system
MAVVHISEAELIADPAALLSRARVGDEIVIQADGVPVVVMKATEPKGRRLSESIALAEAHAKERGYDAVMDADFKADLAEIIANRKPADRSAWE